ncbi:phosphotransferase [Conexibacter woesei]|uniref:Aminoglycoside phosphotransferase n=1 Tax=Conexibacter woesei (strain DSM 14684 / CCUG 47730 / CIP 108061 / JCM 11494 / NBRC 100937 / ID131577) TaxID=469383 RepID=D3F7Y1_CONWI|nr:phosphotransferase [Conexibacter woesei]ADB52875.1 aminoglycoside phosphotransferase [Conexibacter woesei DSM 14684]
MTDVADLRARLTERLPGLEIRSVTEMLNGWDSVVLDVNDELIARFPKRDEVLVQLEKELPLLAELDRRLPGRVPAPTRVGAPTDPDRFLTYSKLHGVALSPELASGSHGPALADQIGELLTVVHGIDTAMVVGFGIPEASAGDWRAQYVELYERISDGVLPTLDPAERASIEQTWRTFLDDPANFAFTPTLVHGDLACEHILCDAGQGTVTGVIDWGDARLGDPAFDFVGLYAECGWDFTRAVAAAYGGEPGATWEQRVAFYTFVIPFIGLLAGAELGDEGILAEARDGLAALLAERA